MMQRQAIDRAATTAFPRTDTLEAKDRNARGQGQGSKETSASALQKKSLLKKFSGDLKKKKKRSSQKFFKRSAQKNIFQKNFQALHKILTIQKILLSSSRGQANFRGLEASRPRTSKCVLEDSTSAKHHSKYLFFNFTNLVFSWNDRRSRRVFLCFYSAIF